MTEQKMCHDEQDEAVYSVPVAEEADKTVTYEGSNEPAPETVPETKKRKRRWGDRPDGRWLRTLKPISVVIPFIMPRRSDACNFFEEEIDITEIEEYIAEKHKQGYMDLGLLHIIIAAYVRTVSQRPGVNRFCVGQRIYAANQITGVMAIKKQLSVDGEETTVKVNFAPTDTVVDVCRKFNATVSAACTSTTGMDKTAAGLGKLPRFLFRWTMRLLRFLDYYGKLPRFLTNVSPFHGSFIITSMGSLGIDAIYHHIYDFGTLPVFFSYGKRYSRVVLEKDGTTKTRHFITFRVVTDERICDGFYYASAFKMLKRYITHPDWLDVPPKEVVEDID